MFSTLLHLWSIFSTCFSINPRFPFSPTFQNASLLTILFGFGLTASGKNIVVELYGTFGDGIMPVDGAEQLVA